MRKDVSQGNLRFSDRPTLRVRAKTTALSSVTWQRPEARLVTVLGPRLWRERPRVLGAWCAKTLLGPLRSPSRSLPPCTANGSSEASDHSVGGL